MYNKHAVLDEVKLNRHNIYVINFDYLLKNVIDFKILNDLSQYGLITDSYIELSSRDVQKAFYHHIILEICKKVLSLRCNERITLFVNNMELPELQLLQFCDEEALQSLLLRIFKKIKRILPVNIFFCDMIFDDFIDGITNREGECTDIIKNIQHLLDNKYYTKFNLDNLSSFVHKNELTYLKDNFFNHYSTKKLLI